MSHERFKAKLGLPQGIRITASPRVDCVQPLSDGCHVFARFPQGRRPKIAPGFPRPGVFLSAHAALRQPRRLRPSAGSVIIGKRPHWDALSRGFYAQVSRRFG